MGLLPDIIDGSIKEEITPKVFTAPKFEKRFTKRPIWSSFNIRRKRPPSDLGFHTSRDLKPATLV